MRTYTGINLMDVYDLKYREKYNLSIDRIDV